MSPPAPDSRTPEVSPLVVSPVPGASDAPVSDAPRDVRLDAPPPSNWPTDPGSGGIAVAPPSRAEKRGRVPESQSVERMLGEAQARQRVQSGAVDTYFGELGRALLASWDAEAHVKDRGGLKWFGKQFVENGGAFMKIWADGAARYGESGVPLAGDTPEPILLERTRDDSGAAARIAYRKQVREQFKARKRATVRVVQRADGTLLSVELVSPSKDPDLDRAAIADIRAAAARIPRPPASGAGIKDPITSLWELELVISISPPVPTVEFEFDEVLGFVDARMPLDRRVYKRIRLVAVE